MKIRDCKYWTCVFYGQTIHATLGLTKVAHNKREKIRKQMHKRIHATNHLSYVRIRNDGPNNGMMHQLGYQILHNGRKP